MPGTPLVVSQAPAAPEQHQLSFPQPAPLGMQHMDPSPHTGWPKAAAQHAVLAEQPEKKGVQLGWQTPLTHEEVARLHSQPSLGFALQSEKPGEHWNEQILLAQPTVACCVPSPAQTVPHPLQLFGSLATSTQPPAQGVPVVQLDAQPPSSSHKRPPSQVRPHAPQLFGSPRSGLTSHPVAPESSQSR